MPFIFEDIISNLKKMNDLDNRVGRDVYKTVSRKAEDLHGIYKKYKTSEDHEKKGTEPGLSEKMSQFSSKVGQSISRKAEDIKDSISDTVHDHGKAALIGAGAIGAGVTAYKYLKNKKSKLKLK